MGDKIFKFLRNSSVCITPRSKSLQCASLSGDNLHDVHHSAETIFPVCTTLRRLSSLCASHRRDNLHGVHHSTETISAVCIPPERVNLRGETIKKILKKNTLACLSVAQMSTNHEKNRVQNLVTLSF